MTNYLKLKFNSQGNKYNILFLILGVLTVLPQLWVKYPGLVDDGNDLLEASRLSLWQILRSGLIDDERLRPVSLIFKKVIFDLFGLQMWGHYLIGGIVLGFICIMVYKVCKEMGVSKYFVSILPLFILLLPSTFANFYRLGTNEPLQLLLLLYIFYFWLKERYWLVSIFSILCLFAKETSLFLVIVFYWLSLQNKNKILSIINFVSLIISVELISHRLSQPDLSYISQARFTLEYLISYIRAGGFSFILDLIAIISTVYILYIKSFGGAGMKILLLLWASSMFQIFIWDVVTQEYYLLVHQVIAVMVIIVGIDRAIISMQSVKRKLSNNLLLIGIWPLFLFVFVKYDLPIVNYWHQKTIIDGNLAGFLLKQNFEKISVYSGISDYEKNNSVYLYSNKWKNEYSYRYYPNIEEWLSHDFGDIKYFEDQIVQTRLDFINSIDENKIYITDMDDLELDKLYFRISICGQTPFMATKCNYVIYCDKGARILLESEGSENQYSI